MTTIRIAPKERKVIDNNPADARAACGVALGVAVLLSSCTWLRPPASATAPVAVPREFATTGAVAAPQKWWRAFGDSKLDALIKRALSDNLDLLSAWDRLAQAEALARRAGADLVPSLTGQGRASRTRAKAGGVTTSRNDFALGLVASYEVDLWGRVRAGRDAAAFEAQATREDLHATAIMLAGEVASTWYRLAEQRGQIALLDEQIETNGKYLKAVTERVLKGGEGVSATDVLQQRQLLEATRAEKLQAQSERQVLAHQLAILLGRPPREQVAGSDGTLPELPPLPGTGLPAELLQRRPDVRAAYLRVAEASRGVAAAVADRFPRLSLSATAEASGGQARDLFDNWLASIAANLTAPILDGARRAAEVDRTRAAASERLHRYGQVVLGSLKEVEDALVEERQQRKVVESLNRQLKLAETVADETQQRYMKGAEDYLRVLTAVQSHQRLQRDRLRAQRQLIEFRIGLYRALGGGWDMTPPAPATAAGEGERNVE